MALVEGRLVAAHSVSNEWWVQHECSRGSVQPAIGLEATRAVDADRLRFLLHEYGAVDAAFGQHRTTRLPRSGDYSDEYHTNIYNIRNDIEGE